MTPEEFDSVIHKQIDQCLSLLSAKGKRYSPFDDKLHNFKMAARLQHTTLIKALTGMMTKHTVKLHDMLADDPHEYSGEDWDEVLADSINYLLLLRAALTEYFTLDQQVRPTLAAHGYISEKSDVVTVNQATKTWTAVPFKE